MTSQALVSSPSYPATRFLAFDTSTDVMSIALTDGQRVWQHTGPGGAKASTTLIPAILALLDQAQREVGLTLQTLDAIVFGQGPGSFTGLRTACAVAQGLAFGAASGPGGPHADGLPVLPVPTLLALAEQARFAYAALAGAGANAPLRITALLDARMDEMYVQSYDFNSGMENANKGISMIRPECLVPEPVNGQTLLLAGNVFGVYAGRLPDVSAFACIQALPTATALLRLAPALAVRGGCVPADQALPLYVRNKVAQTTAERCQAKAEKMQLALVPDTASVGIG